MKASKEEIKRYVHVGGYNGYRPVYSSLAGYYVGVEGAVVMMALLLFSDGWDLETLSRTKGRFDDPTSMEYNAPMRERYVYPLYPEEDYIKGTRGTAPMSEVLTITGFQESSNVLEIMSSERFQRFMQTSYDKNSGNIYFTLIRKVGGKDD